MTQLALSFAPSIQERFEAFHAAHPEVYAELVRLAREARGCRRLGVRALWERMRWSLMIEREGEYKLNDHFPSRYARLLAKEYPELGEMFEMRELRA